MPATGCTARADPSLKGSFALRFIVADWGTTRFRGYLLENETILDQVSSNEGVSALQTGPASRRVPAPMRTLAEGRARRAGAAGRHGGKPRGLGRGALCHLPCRPGGNRQGARCRWISENGRKGYIVPGLFCEPAPGRRRRDARRGDAGSRRRHRERADLRRRHASQMDRDAATGASSASPPT